MLAVKHRHADAPAAPAPRSSDSIRVIGAPSTPRTSPARDMHELIEAKLSAPAATAPKARLSPVAKMGIVLGLATAAWTPVIAGLYAFSS